MTLAWLGRLLTVLLAMEMFRRIPMEKRFITSPLPPKLMKGIGKPVVGTRPVTTAELMKA